jgi:hypothetical protein
MAFLSRFRSLLRNLVQGRRVERELSEEVSSYTELLVEGKMKQGMSERNARRAARLEMAGPSQVKEEVRSIHAGAWLRTCWLDLRHGARVLRNHPGFTTVAVLTFAIDIGANTTIFSMVNGLLFRPLGVQRPERIAYLVEKHEYWGNTFSYPDFEDIRRQSGDCFADLAAMEPFETEGLSVDGRTQTIWTAYVTTNFFSMMGVQPALGSVIVQEKDRLPGSEPALVLLGLLAAAGIAKLAGSFLVGVSAIDPLTFVSVPMLLAAIALLACYLPARRATRVDPMIALRYE